MARIHIDSPKNERVKALVKLRNRRERERSQTYLIEGTREVERALSGNVRLQQLYICSSLLRPEGIALLTSIPADPELIELSVPAFEKVSMRQNPDGVLAVAAITSYGLDTLELPQHALALVLDGLEKPGNIGALLRSADGAGADAVFVTGEGTDLFNPNVVRSSVGSLFSLPVLAVAQEELLKYLKVNGFNLIAASPEAKQIYWEAHFTGASALVLGTEHEGLSSFWQVAVSSKISIPMCGKADSLNVATSGAILLYEALRQRQAKGTLR